jgi:signal transduction histidine kinase
MPNGGTIALERAADHDYPIAIATIPATEGQNRTAIAVIVVLVVVAILIAPFAHLQLARLDIFVPVLQTVLAVADLTTAVLLFAQYLILPQRALLAVASTYLCSASFAFLQTITFPGGYGPAGLIGDGTNSPAWFFVYWHVTFPLGILVYTLLKDRPAKLFGGSSKWGIALTVSCVLVVVAALAWLATASVANLPQFYVGSVTQQTRFGNQINVGLLLWYGLVLVVLLSRRRTILDVWLIVILMAWMPNFLVAAIASSVRFSLGWYAARGFALIASFMLLSVLLTEMTVLYSRLANAFSLLSRERANRLLSVDAATTAIAHEVRSPLGAIALNANTALAQLRSTPPILDEMDDIIRDIERDALRANEVISGVRAIFKPASDNRGATRVNDLARRALTLSEPDLVANQVSVTTGFLDDQVQVEVDAVQIQQVILNLLRNAIEAMATVAPEARRLKVMTEIREGSTILLSVQDAGGGVPAEDRDRIFDTFFTTKDAGMGLGLAISRTIAENHGGTLRLAWSGSKGSIFELALPAKLA